MYVYEKLDKKIQTMIDITMLADKLSSNYLRINFRKVDVRIDLDQVVFGLSGNEFNYRQTVCNVDETATANGICCELKIPFLL